MLPLGHKSTRAGRPSVPRHVRLASTCHQQNAKQSAMILPASGRWRAFSVLSKNTNETVEMGHQAFGQRKP
ncbi:hypothetical protein IE4771_PA00132 (plasmid) [Rhizobium etli bv. mimosae str. IE4771]|uniref:Uncharacterized protein n=1 Tax=Rhizobium etli bv. mimosae str. IE4771 TaxID=1432050 RepID=A0A060I3C7_RHIET|nr:hypothetical protein IE4771_PA00132 [Rhizobium sp. IE4771]